MSKSRRSSNVTQSKRDVCTNTNLRLVPTFDVQGDIFTMATGDRVSRFGPSESALAPQGAIVGDRHPRMLGLSEGRPLKVRNNLPLLIDCSRGKNLPPHNKVQPVVKGHNFLPR